MNKFDDKYALTGKFLVAMPKISDGDYFDHSLVYICSHGRNGAMGLIVNKRYESINFTDLTFQLPVRDFKRLNEVNLYVGGPLEKVRGMVIHSTDYFKEGTVEIGQGIAVSATSQIITDIAFDRGPSEKLVALGYSYWEPHQLEEEIYENDWLVVDANRRLLFNTPDEEKWQRAIDESGINLEHFVAITGHS